MTIGVKQQIVKLLIIGRERHRGNLPVDEVIVVIAASRPRVQHFVRSARTIVGDLLAVRRADRNGVRRQRREFRRGTPRKKNAEFGAARTETEKSAGSAEPRSFKAVEAAAQRYGVGAAGSKGIELRIAEPAEEQRPIAVGRDAHMRQRTFEPFVVRFFKNKNFRGRRVLRKNQRENCKTKQAGDPSQKRHRSPLVKFYSES